MPNLVFLRGPGESFEIEGGITITIAAVRGNNVKILCDVPRHLWCHRSEVVEAIRRENREGTSFVALPDPARIIDQHSLRNSGEPAKAGL